MYSQNTPYYEINENFAQHLISFFVSECVEKESYYMNNHAKFLSNINLKFSFPQFKVDWSLGGTYGHYSGDMNTAEPDIEPEMTQLDDFLIHAYPNTSFMQYKVISRAISHTTYSDSDYYGGRTTHAEKTLNFVDFNDSLIKTKLEQPSGVVNQKQIEDLIAEQYNQDWFDQTFPNTVKKQANNVSKKK